MIGIIIKGLSIVGVILLVILAILIILMAILLFVPVRYSAGFDNADGEIKFRANVSFLLKIINFNLNYVNDLSFSLKIFGKNILSSDEEDKKDGKNKDKTKKKNKAKKKDKNNKKASKKSRKGKKDGKKSGNKGFKDKLKTANEKFDLKYVLNFLLTQLVYLLNQIKPKKSSIDMGYSLGDPAATGWITGFLAMVPWLYGKKNRLYADFESQEIYARGNISVKGRFRSISLVVVIVKCITDKEVRGCIFEVL